jgi:hypothetical protein
MAKIEVRYIKGVTVNYSVEEHSVQVGDYYIQNNCIEFDGIDINGNKAVTIIPFNNVLSIKIYNEEEKIHGKEKRKELTEEADRELLRKN